jgi:type II secretory pathway component PulF
VEEGSTLAQAMEDHADVFDAVCRSCIAAGESGGASRRCSTASPYDQEALQIRGAVIGALVYPASDLRRGRRDGAHAPVRRATLRRLVR